MKTRTFLLVALLATGFLPMVEAGSQATPEITDAADDQALSGGGALQDVLDLLPGADSFDDVDILKAWVNETDDQTFTIGIESAGEVADDTTTTITFSADLGPTSEFGSTADSTLTTITLTGNTVDAGPANTTASSSGGVMTLTLTRADAGINGGDVFRNFTVERSRSAEDLVPVIAPGQDAVDTAGPGTEYVFNRIPVVGAATVTVTGGELGGEAFNATNEIHVHDDTTGFFSLLVTNTGTDVDTFTFAVTVNGTATATATPASFTLNPGANTAATISFDATGAEDSVEIDAHLTSGNGADVETVLTLEVEAHGGSGGSGGSGSNADREVTPSFLEFLTPGAEALGFDEIFEDYAELVLLLLILLLLILLILLLLLLFRRGWLQGNIDPKKQTVSPGDEVDFDLTVQNRRKQFHTVHATFASNGASAGLVMQPEDGQAMDAITEEGDVGSFDLTGKGELGDFAEGTLRVQAPEETGKHHVDVWFTPLDDEGEPRTKKATKIRATLNVVDDAEAPAAALSLGEVIHEPASPTEGDDVTTRTTLHNNDEEAQTLRVVLSVDNDPIQQETVRVAPGSSADVAFHWTAHRGKNKVNVQVFEA
ncbi:MAG: hypothetical protein ACPHK8_04700 [Thermoplasmatota archaeon]